MFTGTDTSNANLTVTLTISNNNTIIVTTASDNQVIMIFKIFKFLCIIYFTFF